MRDRLRVGGSKALGHVHCRLDSFPHRQGTLAEPLAQRLAFEKLRDHVGRAGGRRIGGAVRAHVVNREDVGVIERGDRPRLALEAPEAVRVAGQGLGQDLDRHLAAEPRVARAVDLAHPPGPDEAEDLVRPEPHAGRKWHGRSAELGVRPRFRPGTGTSSRAFEGAPHYFRHAASIQELISCHVGGFSPRPRQWSVSWTTATSAWLAFCWYMPLNSLPQTNTTWLPGSV